MTRKRKQRGVTRSRAAWAVVFADAVEKDWTAPQLATHLNTTKGTVYNACRRLGVVLRRPDFVHRPLKLGPVKTPKLPQRPPSKLAHKPPPPPAPPEPTAPRRDPTGPYEAPMTPILGAVFVPPRHFDCDGYERCLDVAIVEGWLGWDCVDCVMAPPGLEPEAVGHDSSTDAFLPPANRRRMINK